MVKPIKLDKTSMFTHCLGTDFVSLLVQTKGKHSIITYSHSWSDAVYRISIVEADHEKAIDYAINHVS